MARIARRSCRSAAFFISKGGTMQASQRLDRFSAEVFASLNNKLLELKAQGKTIVSAGII